MEQPGKKHRPLHRTREMIADGLPSLPVPSLRTVSVAAAALIALRLAVYAALAPNGLARDLCQWDCDWFLSIAGSGYDLAPHLVRGLWQANWAFFPLFPLLVRLAATLAGVAPAIAGAAVATLALWAFAVLGWLYQVRTRPDASPWPWLLLLAAWPYGFYFDAAYSESLYAALTVACLLALQTGRPWLAAAACACVTATRPTGVLLAAWFGLHRLWRARLARGPAGAARFLAPAALAPLGILGFMAFLWGHVGDPFAFARVQSAWGHTLRNPAAVLLDAVRAADPRNGHIGLLYLVGWALLGFGATGLLAAKRRAAEAWLCAATVLMALLSGVVWSMPRFVACNPAFLLAAADMLEAVPSPGSRATLLLACAAVQVVFVLGWFRGAAFLT